MAELSTAQMQVTKFGLGKAAVARQAAVAAPGTASVDTDTQLRTAVNAVIARMVALGMLEEEE